MKMYAIACSAQYTTGGMSFLAVGYGYANSNNEMIGKALTYYKEANPNCFNFNVVVAEITYENIEYAAELYGIIA